MPGPLPDPKRRRRNAPTIATTGLPAGGRQGPRPRPPQWLELGQAGWAWWRWAWKTPQSAAWNPGHHVVVARRASLEDDLAALARVEGLDFRELLELEDGPAIASAVQRVAALATGRLALARECRELEVQLGLTPKGQAQLRWQVVPDELEERREERAPAEQRKRIRAVDPAG